MNRQKRVLLAVILVLILGMAVVLPSQGKPGAFIINGADGTAEISFQSSSGLQGLLNQVRPRLLVSFANGTLTRPLQPAPAALQSLITAAKAKISVQFANGNDTFLLKDVPQALDGQLAKIDPRIRFQFANANYAAELHFPQQLVGDTARPTLSNIAAGSMPNGRLAISWQTNEFADSKVEIGLNSGSYTTALNDALFVKKHVLYPSGLVPGAKYYFRVTSSDRSSNTTRSQEFTFVFSEKQLLYLPIIRAK